MNKEEIRKMVEDHWEYTEKMMRIAYIESGVHQYKHGWDDCKKEIERGKKR